MKKLLLLLMIVPMIGFGQNKYTWKDVQKKEGVVLLKSTKEPVTGIVEGIGGFIPKWMLEIDYNIHHAVFENGKQISCIAYYKNGEVQHKREKNNDLTIIYTTYYKNGQIKNEGIEDYEGNRNGISKEYDIDGTLLTEGFYKTEEKDGLWKDYNSDGQLFTEITYKDGKFDGSFNVYWENGQLKKQGNHKDGKYHGLLTKYNKDGEVTKETRWENGKKVKSD